MHKPRHRKPGPVSFTGPTVALYVRPDGTLMPVGWRATTRTAVVPVTLTDPTTGRTVDVRRTA